MEYENTKRRRKSVSKPLLFLLALGVVFYIGVNVGNGRIAFSAGLNPINFHYTFDLRPTKHNKQVAKNLPAHLDYDKVDQVYKSLKENYDGQLSQEQLEQGLSHGLAEATKDPYTVYFTAKEAKDFNSQLNNSFSGIGAQLGQDKDSNLEVIAPIAGLPADKAGIKAKDLIASINGQTTSGMSVDEAVNKIRGPKGSKVTLQIVRNHQQSLTFTITRDDIKLPSVKTKILDGNIGYLQITSFSDDTVDLATKAANDFKAKNVKGIVLDLRDDPGGLLDAAVKVSSLWIPDGKNILQEKRGGNIVVDSYNASGSNTLSGIPTVVLVNGGSASASEITAGALHDQKVAYVIGEKSYGKGVVQQLINFGDGSQLKVTVASWYRPDGENINHKGITPDKLVKISDEDAKASNDTQLKAAQAYLSQR